MTSFESNSLKQQSELRESAVSSLFVALLVIIPSLAGETDAKQTRPNVLFIAVDDLRPTLGCYGDTLVKSPNIDRLAASGATFLRAYCQQAVCSPSRTSFLLGLRPDTTRVYGQTLHFRDLRPDAVTLPQAFKNAGYHTLGIGKIYHYGLDDPDSWSEEPLGPYSVGPSSYGKPENQEFMRKMDAAGKGTFLVYKKGKRSVAKAQYSKTRGPSWEDPDVADNALSDGKNTEEALKQLRRLKDGDQPFFLAVGLLKPHLPLSAPKRYFDMYSPSDFSLPPNDTAPKGAPPIALHGWGELRNYQDVGKEKVLSESKALELIHAYYACVTYIDAQIGRMLDELDELGIADNTIVVVWGDHGWHLGEQGLWTKFANFENTTHSPLIIRAPAVGQKGEKVNALVEFVDVYPTLCQLCDISPPSDLEGTSMVRLMEDPNLPWKSAAFSQFPKGTKMGHSMRTNRYRYTEWQPKSKDDTSAPILELYDEQNDPRETVNIANDPENAELIAQLHQQLSRGWKDALPPQNSLTPSKQ